MTTKVTVKFETDAAERFLRHTKGTVVLNSKGEGSFQANDNEWDLIVFGLRAKPGTTAKITLTVEAPAELEIQGHPIEGKVAQGKQVWGSSRFFRVKR